MNGIGLLFGVLNLIVRLAAGGLTTHLGDEILRSPQCMESIGYSPPDVRMRPARGVQPGLRGAQRLRYDVEQIRITSRRISVDGTQGCYALWSRSRHRAIAFLGARPMHYWMSHAVNCARQTQAKSSLDFAPTGQEPQNVSPNHRGDGARADQPDLRGRLLSGQMA